MLIVCHKYTFSIVNVRDINNIFFHTKKIEMAKFHQNRHFIYSNLEYCPLVQYGDYTYYSLVQFSTRKFVSSRSTLPSLQINE